MRKKLLLKFFTVAFCFTILVPLVQAQYRASLRGVVTDPHGAVVSGATVTLLNSDTNAVMTTKTDVAGIYVFNALPTANYKLTLEQSGFKKKVLERVNIIPDQLNALDLELEVGQVQETVVVTDTTQTLDTETATVGTTLGSREVANMPSFGRDVFKLVALAPGVFGQNANGSLPMMQGQGPTSNQDGIFKTENGPAVLSAGQQYQNNGITLDGISTASAVWGGTTIITPTEEAVQEVKVVSHAYDAENGRFSGAQVQVTSKSGTNQFHGSAFFTRHSAGLNAYRWVANHAPYQRDLNIFSQFGGSIGGPIWKNKVFGFFAWETVRSPKNQTQIGTAWFETDALAGKAPAGSVAAKYLGFAGSRPNASGINDKTCADAGLTEGTYCHAVAGGLDIGSPLTSALGTQDTTWQSSTSPGYGNGLDGIADIANYNITSKQDYTDNQYVGRVDANVTSKDRLSGSIYWIPTSKNSQNGDRPYDLFHHKQKNQAFSAIWNRTISPTFVNEARVNAAGWRWNEVDSNPQSPVGLPSSSVDTIGSVGIVKYGPNVGSIFDQWTYSYKDIATKVAGRHTIKFGGELTRLHFLNQCVDCGVPRYNFFNLWSFLNDAPHSEGAAFDAKTGAPTSFRQDDRQSVWGIFVQDDFRVRRNLTVNVGLRWSYFGALSDKNGNMYQAHQGIGPKYLTDLYVSKGHSWSPEKDNFGPQIGFAWSPTMFKDKLVVRGGYGLSFNQFEIALSNGIQNNPGLYTWSGINKSTPSDPCFTDGTNCGIYYAMAADVHSYTYPANSHFKTTYDSNGLPVSGNTGIAIFPQTMPTTRVHHYSLDMQYDLGHNWFASVGYQGSLSRHILFHQNPNAYAASRGYELNPQIGGGDDWGVSGYGNYNALLTEVKHQFGHGFLIDTQFTWAKSMDTGSGPYYQATYSNDSKLNYGLSDYDVKKAFKIYGSYSPTFFRSSSKQWMKTALDGWTISGIFNAHSGFPWTPITNVIGGNLYCGTCGGWWIPVIYKGGAGDSTSNSAYKTGSNWGTTPSQYFTIPTYTAYSGSNSSTDTSTNPQVVGRNPFRGPGYRSVDATLIKAFAIPTNRVLGEAAKLEFRLDAYNLFNNLNLLGGSGNMENGHINNNINSGNFGQSNGSYAGRVVTLGARFNF